MSQAFNKEFHHFLCVCGFLCLLFCSFSHLWAAYQQDTVKWGSRHYLRLKQKVSFICLQGRCLAFYEGVEGKVAGGWGGGGGGGRGIQTHSHVCRPAGKEVFFFFTFQFSFSL